MDLAVQIHGSIGLGAQVPSSCSKLAPAPHTVLGGAQGQGSELGAAVMSSQRNETYLMNRGVGIVAAPAAGRCAGWCRACPPSASPRDPHRPARQARGWRRGQKRRPQPYVLQAATLCVAGCDPMCCRLRPCVLEAATHVASACSTDVRRMWLSSSTRCAALGRNPDGTASSAAAAAGWEVEPEPEPEPAAAERVGGTP